MALIKRTAAYVPVILVYCLALLVRIVYNVTVARGYIPIYDAGLYNIIGHNIASLHCYCLYPPLPNVSRPPLWPFIMSIIDIFAGSHGFYLRLFYCFLGSGTCVLVYLFAKDLFGGRIALITGVIAAVYTGLFIYDGWLYTESLYDFCLTAFAYSLYRLQKAAPSQAIDSKSSSLTMFQSWRLYMVRGRWIILCGLLLGLISLTRPNGPVLLGLVCVWAVIVTLTKILPRQTVIKDTLIIACIGALIVLPWTYRNYTVTGRLIPVSTGMGEVLKGVYDDAVVSGDPTVRGMWRPPPHSINHDNIKYTPQDDAIDTQTALTWIRTHLM